MTNDQLRAFIQRHLQAAAAVEGLAPVLPRLAIGTSAMRAVLEALCTEAGIDIKEFGELAVCNCPRCASWRAGQPTAGREVH